LAPSTSTPPYQKLINTQPGNGKERINLPHYFGGLRNSMPGAEGKIKELISPRQLYLQY
jgi:hypothetical protein